MSHADLTRWIRVEPKYIGDELMTELEKEMTKQLCHKCTKDTGYIIRIINIEKVIDNHIENSSSNIMINVKFTADTFMPRKDVIVKDSPITAIYPDGILIDAMGVQKILIPSSTYKDEFKLTGNELESDDNRRLSVGGYVDVKITAVRYVDHKFSCLGVII